MMDKTFSGLWLYKSLFFIVASFVFSYIFWWTKGFVEKTKKRR